MQYDRKADPNAPFWKRKPKKDAVEQAAEESEEPVVETSNEQVEAPVEQVAEPEPAQETPVERAEAPQAEAPDTNPQLSEAEAIEPAAEAMPESKPPSPGSVH